MIDKARQTRIINARPSKFLDLFEKKKEKKRKKNNVEAQRRSFSDTRSISLIRERSKLINFFASGLETIAPV